jgi:hypothetical protein
MSRATRRNDDEFVLKVRQLGFPAITALGVELMRRLMADGDETPPTELELAACECAVGDLSGRDYDGHRRIFQQALDVLWAARQLPMVAERVADEIERCAEQIALVGVARAQVDTGGAMLAAQWATAVDRALALGDAGEVEGLEADARAMEKALGVPLLTERQEAALVALRRAAAWVSVRLTQLVADLAACASPPETTDATDITGRAR